MNSIGTFSKEPKIGSIISRTFTLNKQNKSNSARMSGIEFQLVKIQKCILKVHIHCEGCAKKVKKVLKGIEGVYEVGMDVEEQKVKVCGIVDSETLIMKLKKSGKHAELWSPIQTENQTFQALKNWITDGQYHNAAAQDLFDDAGHREQEQYVKEIEEIESLMNANNNNFSPSSIVSSIEYQDTLGSFTSYQDLANGGANGFENKDFQGHQKLQTMLPVSIQQEYLRHHPLPVMGNSITPDFGAANGYKYMYQPPHVFMDAYFNRFSPSFAYHS